MKLKYSISSFLVVSGASNEQGSPNIRPQKLQNIVGILTNRDINCFEFNDQLVSDFMTPMDKLIFYEVPDKFT